MGLMKWGLGTSVAILAILVAPRVQADEAARVQSTSHVVRLKNGRSLRGTLSDESTQEEVVLVYRGIGEVRIDRDDVDEVRIATGQIVVEYPATPPTLRKPAVVATPKPTLPEGALTEVNPARTAAIQAAIRELGRWRSQNRVRAERNLEHFGIDAVEPLIPVAIGHSFVLTRRAAFRVLAKTLDRRAWLAALDGLADSDRFVRITAVEILRRGTGSRYGYPPDGSPQARKIATRRWKDALTDD